MLIFLTFFLIQFLQQVGRGKFSPGPHRKGDHALLLKYKALWLDFLKFILQNNNHFFILFAYSAFSLCSLVDLL